MRKLEKRIKRKDQENNGKNNSNYEIDYLKIYIYTVII
jgi:hypothetical protein